MSIHPEVQQIFYVQLLGTSKLHPELSRKDAEVVAYRNMREKDLKDTQMIMDRYSISPVKGLSLDEMETIIDEQDMYDCDFETEEEC